MELSKRLQCFKTRITLSSVKVCLFSFEIHKDLEDESRQFTSFDTTTNCQRVRPSVDRRPDEAADYRAARKCVGEKKFQKHSKMCNEDRDVTSWCDVCSQSARLFDRRPGASTCTVRRVEGFDTHFDADCSYIDSSAHSTHCWWVLCTVAHNCHGNIKYLTAITKSSWQNRYDRGSVYRTGSTTPRHDTACGQIAFANRGKRGN